MKIGKRWGCKDGAVMSAVPHFQRKAIIPALCAGPIDGADMANDKRQSEEQIIQGYFASLSRTNAGAFGLRDDCAIITPPRGCDLVVTTDPVRQGIHFFADDAPADIAWKALAMNVSDLAAKGADPLAYVMAVSFAQFPQDDWLAAFAEGLGAAQEAFAIDLIGGDTDRAPGPLSIAITAFGTVPRGAMVRRGCARPGDLIFVSGTLGNSALGLQLRRDPERARRWALTSSQAAELVARYLRPQPRLALAALLRAHAHAAMDISDGLAKDLGRMCTASGCGAEVQVHDIPLSAALQQILANDPAQRQAVVAGGDDYEILCAVPASDTAVFIEAARALDVPVTAIGRFSADLGVRLYESHGALLELTQTGWDHF